MFSDCKDHIPTDYYHFGLYWLISNQCPLTKEHRTECTDLLFLDFAIDFFQN